MIAKDKKRISVTLPRDKLRVFVALAQSKHLSVDQAAGLILVDYLVLHGYVKKQEEGK